MTRRKGSIRNNLLTCSMLVVAWPALAADVTPERLLNPDKEPQNWRMNWALNSKNPVSSPSHHPVHARHHSGVRYPSSGAEPRVIV
jgi:hypothetical protein